MRLISIRLIYRYIYFIEVENPGKKTKIWTCYNNETGKQVGTVRWNGGWWKYTFKTEGIVEFDHICYDDISAFLQEATAETKKSWRK